MAKLYIADDGTIHEKRTDNRRNHIQDHGTYDPAPEVSIARKVSFWIITMAVSVFIGRFLFSTVGTMIFHAIEYPDDMYSHILNAACTAAPYTIPGCSIACAFFYGITSAEESGYNLSAYFFSAFSAFGGAFMTGVILYFAAGIITIVVYIFVILLILAVIVAALEG